MSVLVTGANGFVGRALTRRLLHGGEKAVRCLVRENAHGERIAELGAPYPGAKLAYVVGDLLNPETLPASLDGVHTIYHLAATMRGRYSDMVMGTVVGSKNLLEALGGRTDVRVVLVSSFSVYATAELPRGAVVDENTPLEPHPTRRGAYAYAKLRQESLFREYAERVGFELAIVRPGAIYGPGGPALTPRVGVRVPGGLLHLGGRNLVPLTYVDNCADAIGAVGRHEDAAGEVFNVVDDDLPTSREYLRWYRRYVDAGPFVPVPYRFMRLIARMVESYHRRSGGQLPPFFTPYKTDSLWKGNTFTNSKLKALGWRPEVSTPEGMRRTFESLQQAARSAREKEAA